MKNINEVVKSLELLNKYPENIAWNDFSDRGNSCYSPYNISSKELNEEADSRAAVLKAMPKYSATHLSLSRSIAEIIGTKWVTYDWLCKILGRIIATAESYSDFEKIIALSVEVKEKMKEKGLSTITSIEEAFQ